MSLTEQFNHVAKPGHPIDYWLINEIKKENPNWVPLLIKCPRCNQPKLNLIMGGLGRRNVDDDWYYRCYYPHFCDACKVVNTDDLLRQTILDIHKRFGEGYLPTGGKYGKRNVGRPFREYTALPSDVSKELSRFISGHYNNAFLLGGVGSTKTTIALAVALEFIKRFTIIEEFKPKYPLVEIISWHNLLQLCSRSEAISSPNENYSDELLDPNDARVLIQRMKRCNLLIIDDVGTSAMNTDARRDRVYDVLNCRIEDEDAANETPSKQNLVTSNLSDDQFIGATSERILSRLSYKSVVVSINSEDKRKKTMEGNYV